MNMEINLFIHIFMNNKYYKDIIIKLKLKKNYIILIITSKIYIF